MSFIRLAMAILLLTAVSLAGLYLAEKKGWVAQGTFSSVIAQAGKIRPPKQLTEHPEQVKQFVAMQAENASQNGEVLGASLSVEKVDPPLSQKAFEYARYAYCQAAVKDYEQRFGAGTPLETPATPTPGPTN